MPFYDRFEMLCKEKKIKPQSKEMQKIAGVSSPAISNWNTKNALPKAETLCNLSKFFDVSIDYLMGLTKVRKNQNEEILEIYNELNEENKRYLLRTAQLLQNEQREPDAPSSDSRAG